MLLMLLMLLMPLMLLTPDMIGRGDDTSDRGDMTGLLWVSWRISEQAGVPVHR